MQDYNTRNARPKKKRRFRFNRTAKVIFSVIIVFVLGLTVYFNGKVEAAQKEQENLIQEYRDQILNMQKELDILEKQNKELKHKLGNEIHGTGIKIPPAQKPPKQKVAYLTFDDGPTKNTLDILRILEQQEVKATFFVTGLHDKNKVETLSLIHEKGHSIGNHSYSHDYKKIYTSATDFYKDFNKAQKAIEAVTGKPCTLFRFPGGSNNTVSHRYGKIGLTQKLAQELNNAGVQFFDWNVDSGDATANKVPTKQIVNNVLQGAKHKQEAIILMHDAGAKTTTVEALPKIIEGLKKEGFIFKVLDETSPAIHFIKK